MNLEINQIQKWRNAVFAIFFLMGWLISSWLARIPGIAIDFQIDNFRTGMLLFGLSSGSITGLLLSSHIIAHLGTKKSIIFAIIPCVVGMIIAGAGVAYTSGYYWSLCGLFIFGSANSIIDVAMNVSGAANEQKTGRTLMPTFHASWSIGTAVGAGVAALLVKLKVSVAISLLGISLLTGFLLFYVSRYLPEKLPGSNCNSVEKTSIRERLAVWCQPVTIAIGIVVMGMSIAEGAAGDWLAKAMVDQRNFSAFSGALIYGAFTIAMTLGRIVGGRLLDRFGRVATLRVSALTAAIGLSLVIWVPVTLIIILGVLAWGMGVSLGFPVGISAAADDPEQAGPRVSVVATIGYLAFLSGPPLLGFIGQKQGLLNALIVVLGALVIAGLLAPSTRENKQSNSLAA